MKIKEVIFYGALGFLVVDYIRESVKIIDLESKIEDLESELYSQKYNQKRERQNKELMELQELLDLTNEEVEFYKKKGLCL